MKIDTEGSEYGLLQGASETLKKKSLLAVIIEGQSKRIDQFFYDTNFTAIDYLPFLRELKPCGKRTSNKLWIKKDKLALTKRLLASAKTNSVYGQNF